MAQDNAQNNPLGGIDIAALSNIPLSLELAEKIITGIQKNIYGEQPFNSFEPFHEPIRAKKENGQYIVTEICYGNEYPNSYLDITYPNEDRIEKHPTVFYTHGGGFFGGNKSMGDPLAAGNPANTLFDEIVTQGFNLVNVDYALMPEGIFPIPLIQLAQAIDFCRENAEEYGLDMTRVIIFGGSAGAILTAQYGALIANPAYQEAMQIYPEIDKKSVKALIVDDAPLIPENFNWALKVMLGNYCRTIETSDVIFKKYNALRWFVPDMAPAFFDAGTIDGFPKDMIACGEKLTELGVENEVYIPDGQHPHGFLNAFRDVEQSAMAVRHVIAFMKKYTG